MCLQQSQSIMQRAPPQTLQPEQPLSSNSPPRYEELVPKRRIPWAKLLQRVFEVDALRCPRCGGRMRVLAAITDPMVAARILRCLALPSRAPPLAIYGDGAGYTDSAVDETFGGIPEFNFDQSRPSGDDESSA